MDYGTIRAMQTSIEAEQMRQYLAEGCKGVHESVLRSYQILEKVKWLLQLQTSPRVIAELIDFMEAQIESPQHKAGA